MTGATLSATATLGTAVDVSRTFVLAGARTVGAGPDIGARMVRAQLTNPTTITFDRGNAGSPDDMNEISWQAVELTRWFDRSARHRQLRGRCRPGHGHARHESEHDPRHRLRFRCRRAARAWAALPTPGTTCWESRPPPRRSRRRSSRCDRNNTVDTADIAWFVVQFAGGDGFKVGSFTKATGAAPDVAVDRPRPRRGSEGAHPVDRGPIGRDVQQRLGRHVSRRVDGKPPRAVT